jgi:hypothetical protein
MNVRILCGVALTGVLIAPLTGMVSARADMTAYYVSQSSGNDAYDGRAAQYNGTHGPWKTLGKAGSAMYGPADSILLKCGDEWNEQLTITNSNGTPANPICLSSFGAGANPKVRRDSTKESICIRINNASGWKITNLDVGFAGEGILLWYTTSGNQYVWIENCYFHDIDGIDYWTYAGEPTTSEKYRLSYSAGICLAGFYGTSTVLRTMRIRGCNSDRAKCLFQVACQRTETTPSVLKNFIAENCVATGGTFGWWVLLTDSGYVDNVKALHTGVVPFQSGTTAAGIFGISNFEVRNCEFGWNDRSGGPDGCGFDFEGCCTNVTLSNSYIHDNDGYGVFMFQNVRGNTNCVVKGCTLINNAGNPANSGVTNEIYFSSPGNDAGGSIINNTYALLPGNTFIDAYTNCTLSGNTRIYPLTNFFRQSYTGSRNNYTGYVGFEFTPSSSITVTALGRPVSGSMNNNHVVDIWSASNQQIIASVTITPSSNMDPLGYKYEALPSSVTLNAGTAYRIASWEKSGGDAWMDEGSISNHVLDAAINSGVHGDSSATYPGNVYGSAEQGYAAPAFFTGNPQTVSVSWLIRSNRGNGILPAPGIKKAVCLSRDQIVQKGSFDLMGRNVPGSLKLKRPASVYISKKDAEK